MRKNLIGILAAFALSTFTIQGQEPLKHPQEARELGGYILLNGTKPRPDSRIYGIEEKQEGDMLSLTKKALVIDNFPFETFGPEDTLIVEEISRIGKKMGKARVTYNPLNLAKPKLDASGSSNRKNPKDITKAVYNYFLVMDKRRKR
jgi:hypothetical protein